LIVSGESELWGEGKKREPLFTPRARSRPFCCATFTKSSYTILLHTKNGSIVRWFGPPLNTQKFIFKKRRDKFTIHSKAVVCQDVEMRGDITIGSGRTDTTARNRVCKSLRRNRRPPQGFHFRAGWSNYYWDELHTRGRNNHCQPVGYNVANRLSKSESVGLGRKRSCASVMTIYLRLGAVGRIVLSTQARPDSHLRGRMPVRWRFQHRVNSVTAPPYSPSFFLLCDWGRLPSCPH